MFDTLFFTSIKLYCRPLISSSLLSSPPSSPFPPLPHSHPLPFLLPPPSYSYPPPPHSPIEIGEIEHGVVVHGCGLDEVSPLGTWTLDR
jgi:hypothetical protein